MNFCSLHTEREKLLYCSVSILSLVLHVSQIFKVYYSYILILSVKLSKVDHRWLVSHYTIWTVCASDTLARILDHERELLAQVVWWGLNHRGRNRSQQLREVVHAEFSLIHFNESIVSRGYIFHLKMCLDILIPLLFWHEMSLLPLKYKPHSN